MEANDVGPEDGGALSKVDGQVEQQDLAKVVPHLRTAAAAAAALASEHVEQ
jgi:hypothetical protein